MVKKLRAAITKAEKSKVPKREGFIFFHLPGPPGPEETALTAILHLLIRGATIRLQPVEDGAPRGLTEAERS
jgi:hypothetical protein